MSNLKVRLVRDKGFCEFVNVAIHVGMFAAASALSACAMAAAFPSLFKFPYP